MVEKEGLLCPECFKEFSSVDKLQLHFNSTHNDANAVLNVLKKAKNTVENIFVPKSDNPFDEIEEQREIVSTAFYEVYNEPCKGNTRNLNDEFKSIRRKKVRCATMDVSNLLLKLEKLLACDDMSWRKRREYEQSIVDWIDDELVALCPCCGHKFGLNSPLIKPDLPKYTGSNRTWKNQLSNLIDTVMNVETSSILIRKKHHCRLCGGVMCAWCSNMLPLSEASKLLDLVSSSYNSPYLTSNIDLNDIMWKTDSQSSLDSTKIRLSNGEYSIRCCTNCQVVIDNKWSQLTPKCSYKDITDLYQKLNSSMNEVLEKIREYNEIRTSLMNGSVEYSYVQASNLRSSIVERCLQIDSMGKQFKEKANRTEGSNYSQRESLLFTGISRKVMYFLQDYFASLKELPDLKKIEEIRENKKKLFKEEIAKIKFKQIEMNNSRRTILDENGWAPKLNSINNTSHSLTNYHETDSINSNKGSTNTNPFDLSSSTPHQLQLNTLAEQMEYVRQYIAQAQLAQKYDEVKLLKQNMHDLEKEYERIYGENKRNNSIC